MYSSGWRTMVKKMNVIGINEGHNSSVCLITDGEVRFAMSEERLSRKKNEVGFPEKSLRLCMKNFGLAARDIEAVAIASIELSPTDTFCKRGCTFGIRDYIIENHEYWKPILIEGKNLNYFHDFLKRHREYDKSEGQPYDFSFLSQMDASGWSAGFREERVNNLVKNYGIPRDKIEFIDHHTAHAAYAYYASPIRDDALVVTADGWGDGANASFGIGDKGALEIIKKTRNNNLARLYRWATLILGMKPNEHEYKVMGLAPYSKHYLMEYPYKLYSSTLVVDGDDFKWRNKPQDMYFWFRERLEGSRFDGIAAGLQKFIEDRMVEWVKNILRKHKASNLVFSGGLALNVKLNKRLMEMEEIRNIHIPPSGGDESLAIGAAYHACSTLCRNAIRPLESAYLGPEFDNCDIMGAIKERGIKSRFIVKENVSIKEVAGYLAEGKVVGRCTGRMEFGARALGNRSILSNPKEHETIRILNEKIKFRDFWMPFTPSILKEDVGRYIENPKGVDSPYMTLGFETTEEGKRNIKAAIHPYDKTARPQFVDKGINPEYHELISEFRKQTGIGCLLNTSLNLHGEPIACSPADALHILENSKLDMLYMNDILIMRK